MKRVGFIGWAGSSACGVLRALAASAVLAVLAACGGVGDLAGVGSGGSGLAEGTVTGFGSVYVDGERYDDSGAVVTEEGPDGSRPATLKLGQRVRVQTARDNVAESIQVIAELIGPIERIDSDTANDLRLTVVGQQVRVDKVASGASGAATWVDFGEPCAPNCTLSSGQWIQVHGTWVMDAMTNAYYLLASRVEVTEPQLKVLVSGVVREVRGNLARLNASAGKEVDLRDLAGAAPPAVDQVLRVWAAPPANMPGAAVVADRAASAPMGSAANVSRMVLGGEVSRVSADGAEIEIQGNRIAVPPELRSVIAPQSFVRLDMEKGPNGWIVKGQPKFADSSERAQVRITEEISVAQLRLAQQTNWRLRGTALGGVELPPSCSQFLGEPPGTQVRVTVQAIRGPLPMRISSLQCSRG